MTLRQTGIQSLGKMLNPTPKSEAVSQRPKRATGRAVSSQSIPLSDSCALMERPVSVKRAKRRSLPNNFLLKVLDTLYWRRLLRYLYIRLLRMQGSSEAIARGFSAGVFAGAFPLLGFQTIIGIAIAALFRGNKVMAAVGTWISNPLTYVPLMALNFNIGRWLLQLPDTTVIPSSFAGLSEWMELGRSVTAALMVGSLVVGSVLSVVGYYLGLVIAYRLRSARHRS